MASFQNTVCKIRLNSITDIPVENYAGLYYYNSIKDGLPYGYFDINDQSGKYMASFENLQIGAEVEINIVDIDSEVEYPLGKNLVILNSEAVFDKKADQFMGIIRVWFGHAWFLYKDVKNHAYQPMNSAKLIEKILKSKDRGIAFNVEKGAILETDDEGKIARYKVCETDWDFIQNKILPYCAINQLPVHFFNDTITFNLKSFKDLYTQNPMCVFMPAEGNLTSQEQINKIQNFIKTNNIKISFPIQESFLKIGNIEMFDELFPSFYFENLEKGTFFTGQKRLGNKIISRSGSNFGNILPLDQKFMFQSSGSSVKIIHNRQAIDSFSLLFETGKNLDFAFNLVLQTGFNGMIIGKTASVFAPDTLGRDGKEKEHWLNGKWMINTIEHFNNPENYNQMYSRTHLVRSNFIGNDNKTSLGLSAMMYGAP